VSGAPIRLMVVDVDGTLLTPHRQLTPRAVGAVAALRAAGVQVALTSGRPPRGMRMLVEPLALETPLAAFNGGMFVRPDAGLELLEEHALAPEAATAAAELLLGHGLDLWVYRGTEWYVRDAGAPHVERERRTVEFTPTVARDLGALLDRPVKLVGVSDDHPRMALCEADVQQLDFPISAARSQPYYLDVTHRDANKGAVVQHLSGALSVPPEQIATIGDMPNDVGMFEVSGLSIAMGNADPEVRRSAHHVTTSNSEEGFATAVREIVLPRAR
jgi:Cof subfamily protein (haloacid dehalogenase superfamily)